MAVHDWSTVAFGAHPSKRDRRRLTHDADVGYDLATVLVVRGTDGTPLAPVSVRLTAAGRVLSTDAEVAPAVAHVDQVRGQMDVVAGLDLGAPVVHVIDREADSVGHWRDGHAAGYRAVVRTETTGWSSATGRRRGGRPSPTGWPSPTPGRPALAGDRPGGSSVVLHRPAKRWDGDRRRVIAGEPLAVRLVAAEWRDAGGRVLARGLLLTNVPAATADAATVATWYYWRWRIESFHQLLKAAGWELEKWLQRTGGRVLRKRLAAVAAVVAVWALERRTDAASREFQRLLMTLSGRQTKRSVPVTTTGLRAGLWVLQQAAGWLARDDPNALRERHLPRFAQAREQV